MTQPSQAAREAARYWLGHWSDLSCQHTTLGEAFAAFEATITARVRAETLEEVDEFLRKPEFSATASYFAGKFAKAIRALKDQPQ